VEERGDGECQRRLHPKRRVTKEGGVSDNAGTSVCGVSERGRGWWARGGTWSEGVGGGGVPRSQRRTMAIQKEKKKMKSTKKPFLTKMSRRNMSPKEMSSSTVTAAMRSSHRVHVSQYTLSIRPIVAIACPVTSHKSQITAGYKSQHVTSHSRSQVTTSHKSQVTSHKPRATNHNERTQYTRILQVGAHRGAGGGALPGAGAAPSL